jgi:predicted alpha/beta hydrolase family esterase
MTDMPAGAAPTVLIVPGLRDHLPTHWQTLLAADLQRSGRAVRTVAPMGRDHVACEARVHAIEREARAIAGPFVIVAHSAGCLTVAHWARHTSCPAHGALLATPPDFEQPLPEGYPTLAVLRAAGWLPVPREALPFPSIVAASRDDPLGSHERAAELARDWGARLVDLGHVGHLNPASGYGHWGRAREFVDALCARA